jgi:hypothetical protein
MTREAEKFTESCVAEELGVDRLELYLAAAEQHLGQYDVLTHLMVFSDAEVDALAARRGVTRRRRPQVSEAQKKVIPEPSAE